MRVLLAVDGSRSSIQARDLVAGLTWPSGTRMWLMSAYETPIDLAPPGVGMPWVDDAGEAVRDELATELEHLAEPLRQPDRVIQQLVVCGRPATAILDQARQLGADLIVVGSRGRGPFATMLLGSVSAEVVDHAPCPILVARTDRISRLLVATDGSDPALAIPQQLGTWAVFRGIPAEAVSVAPPPERTYELLADVYTMGAYQFGEERQSVIDRHRRLAEDLARRLADVGIEATATALTGDAAHEIITAAKRSRADLIVTGSRGLQGLDRLVLGSVARNVVLHAPCSVLVVRPPPPLPQKSLDATEAASV